MDKEDISFGGLWVEENRPEKIEDYVVRADVKEHIANMLKSRQLTNLTLCGIQGIGKTSLARLICKEMNAVETFVECGRNGRVDYLQGELSDVCHAVTPDGRLKIIILDEIDCASASGENSFIKSLKNLIDSSVSDTRWILTCNTLPKNIEPILSRCPLMKITYKAEDLLIRVKEILNKYKIEYTTEDLTKFVRVGIKSFYPDIRSIIQFLQQSCASGKLIVNKNVVSTDSSNSFVKDLVEKMQEESNILNIRKFMAQNKEKIPDPVSFASELFNYVLDKGIVTDVDKILKMTDKLYQLNMVIDKETGLFGLVCAING